MRLSCFASRSALFLFVLGGAGCAGGSNGSGAAGMTGSAGATGVAGTTGAAGAAGTTGVAGTTGAAGTTGVAGTTGAAGTTGSAGTTGAAGATGAPGRGRGGNDGRGGRGGSAGTTGAAARAAEAQAAARLPTGSAAKFICASGRHLRQPAHRHGNGQTDCRPVTHLFRVHRGPDLGSAACGTVFFSDNASSPTERIFQAGSARRRRRPCSRPTAAAMGWRSTTATSIVAADQRNKRIVVLNPMTGQTVGTPVSTGSAKPNDVIVRSDDNVYFTDSGHRLLSDLAVRDSERGDEADAGRAAPTASCCRHDENTLYVGDAGNRTIAKYTLAADGTVMAATGTNSSSAADHARHRRRHVCRLRRQRLRRHLEWRRGLYPRLARTSAPFRPASPPTARLAARIARPCT